MKLPRRYRIKVRKIRKFIKNHSLKFALLGFLLAITALGFLYQGYRDEQDKKDLIINSQQDKQKYIQLLEENLKKDEQNTDQLEKQINELKKQVNLPVRDKVLAYINTVFGADTKQAIAVAYCENNPDRANYNPNAQNNNTNGSFDSGPFQVNSTHMDRFGDKFVTDWKENIRVAFAIYKEQGLSPWYSSRGCWGPKIVAFEK